MKRPTIRLALMMEWVAALAVGFAVLRWVETDKVFTWYSPVSPTYLPISEMSAFLSGVAFTEFIMLGWESLRHRRPPIWGLGRWTWASTGIYLLLGGVVGLANSARWFLYQWQSGFPFEISEIRDSVRSNIVRLLGNGIGPTFIISLIAGAVAARLARWPRDPAPDSREWSGRIFAVVLVGLVVVQNVREIVLVALGFPR